MGKSSDVKVTGAKVWFEPVPFRAPLKFGGRVMSKSTLMNVEVTVESRGEKHAAGFGSMPVGHIWAWPSSQIEPEVTEKAMTQFAEHIVGLVDGFDEFGHPVDLMFQLGGEYPHGAKVIKDKLKLPEPLPTLAQLVAASPVDAALHDAFGKVNGVNSYNALSSQYMNYDLAEYLDPQFKGEYLDQYTLREPKPRMPLYHLIGAIDPLTEADVENRPKDNLPVTLGEWIKFNGLTHLKIKLNGDDLAWDVQRVLAIDAVASETQAKRGCAEWWYSTDFNEKCSGVDYVLDFLKQIKAKNPQAYDRIQYVEQPTHRDLRAHPEHKMHAAAKLKPIVIDESLVDYESLLLAREQGYSGVALKACKGQTEALLAAAAAQKFGLFLCVQDLTCPGFSFLHSASLAARIPGVAAIEGNSRQYCPAANKSWARTYPPMFDIKDGSVGTSVLTADGLGF